MAKAIIERLPEHTCYVEVFGGGLAVLLAKERSQVEVANDINGDLIGFYRCVRYHRDELLRELAHCLHSRQDFTDYREQAGLTDIQRAARWFYLQTRSFGGKGESYGYGRTRPAASSLMRLEAIEHLSRRLDRVYIEHVGWQELLQRYDHPGTCFFLDPPYVVGHQYGGAAGSWGEADHVELAEALRQVEGQWVVTYDDEPEIRELYEGCSFHRIERKAGMGNNHGRATRTIAEVIITPSALA